MRRSRVARPSLPSRPYDPPPDPDPATDRYAQLQKSYYLQRKAQFDDQIHAYDEQIAQVTATIAKLQNDEARYTDRAKLAKEVEQMRATLAAAQVGSRLNLLAATDQKTELLRNLEYDRNSLVESQHQLQATIATRNAFTQQWLGRGEQGAGHRPQSARCRGATARKGDKAQGPRATDRARGLGGAENGQAVGRFGAEGGRSADLPGAAALAGRSRGAHFDARYRVHSRRRPGEGQARRLQFHRARDGGRKPFAGSARGPSRPPKTPATPASAVLQGPNRA